MSTHSTTGQEWEYHYDTANHLTEVQRWSDNTVTATLEYDADYAYNAFGLRVIKVEDKDGAGSTHSAVTSQYEHDGWNPATANGLVGRENFAVRAKLDGSNAVATQYLLSDKIDDGLGRIDVGGTTEVRWTLTDFQKSVRTILDGTGAVIGDLAYDAFGNKTLETAPTQSGEYGYTGREWDKETELQYNRARWYDPKTARWLTQDPLGFDAGDTNLYRYVYNGATGSMDPSGLEDYRIRDGEFRWIVEAKAKWWQAYDPDIREFRIGTVYQENSHLKRGQFVQLDSEFGGYSIPLSVAQDAVSKFWSVFGEIGNLDNSTQHKYVKAAIVYQLHKKSIEEEVRNRVQQGMGSHQTLSPPLHGNSRFDQNLSQLAYIESQIRRDVIFDRFRLEGKLPEGLQRDIVLEALGPNGWGYDLAAIGVAGAARLQGKSINFNLPPFSGPSMGSGGVSASSAPQSYTRAYRAVSAAEYMDIVRTGRFNSHPNALEGRWFSETLEGARAHGRGLYPQGGFHIVEADLPNSAPSLHLDPNLDGRGPARYLHLDDLRGIQARPVE